jgi:hypothetical protein
VSTILFSCSNKTGPATTNGAVDSAVAASYRIYSETKYFDAGGSTTITPVTTRLELDATGVWRFGTSSGTWSVAALDDADWQGWGVAAYGPTRKLMLDGWNNARSEGPIEEQSTGVDFVWVIYRVDDPSPGTIWMKFGR